MMQALTIYRRSQVEDADCLYRWKHIWLDGVDDSSDYSLRGQAFAKIKHLYILKLNEHGVSQDFDLATQAFIEGVAEHQTPQRLIPELRELWIRHAEVFALDLDRYLTSEERHEGEGLSWSPDLVYAHPNELEIVDDKTFWVCLTEAEVRASFQGRFYVREAMKRWPGFASYRFTMFFVRFNRAVSVVFSPAELAQLDMEVEAARARLELAAQTDSWPAVAGPSCRYCELRCPLVEEQSRLPIRVSQAQAPAVAAVILTGDKMVKGLKKALKAYCAAYGPVMVGDIEFNNRPVLERKYPLMKVVEVIQERGQMGAFDDLAISHSSLGKVFRAFPDIEKELAPSVETKTSFRFGSRKPGGDEEGEDA